MLTDTIVTVITIDLCCWSDVVLFKVIVGIYVSKSLKIQLVINLFYVHKNQGKNVNIIGVCIKKWNFLHILTLEIWNQKIISIEMCEPSKRQSLNFESPQYSEAVTGSTIKLAQQNFTMISKFKN